MTTRTPHPPKPWCQLWFNATGPPISIKATRVEHVDYQRETSGITMPFLVTCRVLPHVSHLQPLAVSLLPQPCTSTSNLLQVVGAGRRLPSAYVGGRLPDPSSRSLPGYAVAVCGPALYYYHQDFSWRMVEWLELLRAQGIAKVFLYETDVHPNLQKVLRYYEKEGFVSVTKYMYPPPYNNEPSTRRFWTMTRRTEMFAQENIYFSDCLLRHMHQYRFIAHYDPDEVPVLLHHRSYTTFFNELLNKTYSQLNSSSESLPEGYKLEWKIFYDDLEPPESTRDLPPFLHVLRHILLPKKNLAQSPGTSKTLYDMDTVTGVYSHEPFICSAGKCRKNIKKIESSVAYLGHYTRECGAKCKRKGYLKEEPTLLQYTAEVQPAVTEVLTKLNLL